MSQPTAASLSDSVAFSAVTAADFDELVSLRIAAMRDSLERVGRFDPERARARLRKSFCPEHTEFIILDGQRIGFSCSRRASWPPSLSLGRSAQNQVHRTLTK